jgi:hypothetical protein
MIKLLRGAAADLHRVGGSHAQSLLLSDAHHRSGQSFTSSIAAHATHSVQNGALPAVFNKMFIPNRDGEMVVFGYQDTPEGSFDFSANTEEIAKQYENTDCASEAC